MKKVVVTGANGFIGVHTLEMLEKSGYEVHALALDGEELKNTVPGLVTWHRIDLFNRPAVSHLIDSLHPTHLLHLAWYTEHGKYWNAELNLDWVGASLELLKAFRACGGKRAVLAGTCAEYDWSQKTFSEKSTLINPSTLYGAAKNSLRTIAERYCKQNRMSFAWGRIFQPFGPFEARSRLVPSVILALLSGKPANCTSGTQVRDFLYTPEVASAFTALTDSGLEGTFNIASGKGTPVKDIVTVIGNKIGRPELLHFGNVPSPDGEPPVLVADTGRLENELGWRPRGTLDDWLDLTIEWWKEKTDDKK